MGGHCLTRAKSLPDGMTLDTKGLVEKRVPYAVEVEVRLPGGTDVSKAILTVGRRPFDQLAMKPTVPRVIAQHM